MNTGIIDPPHALSLSLSLPPFPPSLLSLSRFDPLPRVCIYIRVSCPVSLASPYPFIRPARFHPVLHHHHRPPMRCITRLSRSVLFRRSLYLPPSAPIAFTTISFYVVTFSACETRVASPQKKTLSSLLSRNATGAGGKRLSGEGEGAAARRARGRREGEGQSKRKKNKKEESREETQSRSRKIVCALSLAIYGKPI